MPLRLASLWIPKRHIRLCYKFLESVQVYRRIYWSWEHIYPLNTNEAELHDVFPGNVRRVVDDPIPFQEAELQEIRLPELAGHDVFRPIRLQS